MRVKLGSKFAEYALEFLLVVGGISGSFWIENYREDLADQRLEQEYLQGLKTDLGRDTLVLQQFIGFQKARAAGCFAVLALTPAEPTLVDTMARHFGAIINYQLLNRNDNTLRALQSASHFRLLRNEALRNQLLELDRTYLEIQRAQEHLLYDLYEQLYPIFFEQLDLKSIVALRRAGMLPADRALLQRQLAAMLPETKTRNMLFVVGYNAQTSLPVFQKCLEEVQALLIEIERDLAG